MKLPRILIVDDEDHILASYRKILVEPAEADQKMDRELWKLHDSIFGSRPETPEATSRFDLDFASQGSEAVQKVREANTSGNPFALVFLDMRMPPGQGGLPTAKQIRRIDRQCNIVIVTAYSDVDLTELAQSIQPPDKLFYLRKPFVPQEIAQFAAGLTAKWIAEKQLEALLDERTEHLIKTNIDLQKEMDIRRQAEIKIRNLDEFSRKKAREAQVASDAIHTLFYNKLDARKEFEESILFNVRENILPQLNKLKKCASCLKHKKELEIIENSLTDLLSPFLSGLAAKFPGLTPSELNIANLISKGKKTKEISEVLSLSLRTVEFHREQLRDKLGIRHSGKSLKTFLQDLVRSSSSLP